MRAVLDVNVIVSAFSRPLARPPGCSRLVLVSGDSHLLGLAKRIPVFTPAGFEELLAGAEAPVAVLAEAQGMTSI